jgi:hypothetical protein
VKQTAVEWLVEQFASIRKQNSGYRNIKTEFKELIKQAKEMEKEHICYFYVKGAEAEINNPYVSNIEFYNETFKSE